MSLSVSVKSLIKACLPPSVLRQLRSSPASESRERAMDAFYRSLIPEGSLCFDIGANVGERVRSFRRLRLPVVAVEPQTKCFASLESEFRRDSDVILVNKALGRSPGEATMFVSDTDVLSTLSTDFLSATSATGRFGATTWEKHETVSLTTFDTLIKQHGRPYYAKIDVEGYEFEVLSGLTQPIPLVSIEWTPELTDITLRCLDRLSALGPAVFNFSRDESFVLSSEPWSDKQTMADFLNANCADARLFGDVYIRTAV